MEMKLKNNICNDLDANKAVNDLSFFLQCKTVSYIDQSRMDFNEFKKIHEYLKNNYPNIEKYGKSKVINEGSIYYYIEGQNKDLGALVLMGHLDVVPPIMLEKWEYDPFSGKVADGHIYGRGSLDMKDIDAAVANAVEYNLAHNKKPLRSIYLCFGHDEETLGMKGQYQIKEDIKKSGQKISMVIDEGGAYADGNEYKADANLILIQVMEKGYLDVEITGKDKGGHSSRSNGHTALGNVAHAISKIEDNPFKASLNIPLIKFYKEIKDYIYDDELKKCVENIDNNPDMLANYLLKDEKFAPYVHTTIAATMIDCDSKGANVLPQNVKANINLRLSDKDKVDDTIAYLKDLCKDIDVTIEGKNAINASNISNVESNEYNFLKSQINEYFNGIVVPSITVGGTDCCFYNDICDNCYRFSPIFNKKELSATGVHGYNEHCNIDAYLYGIKFYIDLIGKYCY